MDPKMMAQIAKQRLAKQSEAPGEIEVEITATPPEPGKPAAGKPPAGKPPGGDDGLAAEIDACAKQYGMSRDEVIAEFKEYLADKKAGDQPAGDDDADFGDEG